jgi:putative ABC transport system ATP-binding protein
MEQVARVFGSGEAAVRACDRIHLTICSGEYCAIMGQSGSGKSTLMTLIGCLDRPTSGRYYLDGVDISAIHSTRLTRLRNRKIGCIFQRYELLPHLTALGNVMLPMMYAGVGRSPLQWPLFCLVAKRLQQTSPMPWVAWLSTAST